MPEVVNVCKEEPDDVTGTTTSGDGDGPGGDDKPMIESSVMMVKATRQ